MLLMNMLVGKGFFFSRPPPSWQARRSGDHFNLFRARAGNLTKKKTGERRNWYGRNLISKAWAIDLKILRVVYRRPDFSSLTGAEGCAFALFLLRPGWRTCHLLLICFAASPPENRPTLAERGRQDNKGSCPVLWSDAAAGFPGRSLQYLLRRIVEAPLAIKPWLRKGSSDPRYHRNGGRPCGSSARYLGNR